MKKMNVFVSMAALSLTMVTVLTACGGADYSQSSSSAAPETGSTQAGSVEESSEAGNTVDLSAYPEDISEWTSDQVNQYFIDAGVYTNSDYVYVQDHASYYAGTPINECAGYMDNDGLISIGVFLFDPELQETGVEEMIAQIKEDHKIVMGSAEIPADHMIGNVVFWYSATTDEEVYNAMDKAYNDLVAALGVTPEF